MNFFFVKFPIEVSKKLTHRFFHWQDIDEIQRIGYAIVFRGVGVSYENTNKGKSVIP